jgi:hypothetical protein
VNELLVEVVEALGLEQRLQLWHSQDVKPPGRRIPDFIVLRKKVAANAEKEQKATAVAAALASSSSVVGVVGSSEESSSHQTVGEKETEERKDVAAPPAAAAAAAVATTGGGNVADESMKVGAVDGGRRFSPRLAKRIKGAQSQPQSPPPSPSSSSPLLSKELRGTLPTENVLLLGETKNDLPVRP